MPSRAATAVDTNGEAQAPARAAHAQADPRRLPPALLREGLRTHERPRHRAGRRHHRRRHLLPLRLQARPLRSASRRARLHDRAREPREGRAVRDRDSRPREAFVGLATGALEFIYQNKDLMKVLMLEAMAEDDVAAEEYRAARRALGACPRPHPAPLRRPAASSAPRPSTSWRRRSP